MSEQSSDIVIIGGGLAAYAAAVELHRAGKKVTIVSKGPGATALSSGAWDLADNPLCCGSDPWGDLPDIRKNLVEIIQRFPFHPYAILKQNFTDSDFFKFLFDYTLRAASELPLPLFSTPGKNMMVVTSLGTLQPTAFVQGSMAEANVCAMEKAKVLVVGIQGYPEFSARFIRHALLAKQESQENLHIGFAGHFEVEMPDVPSGASLNAVTIARHIDREKTFVKFGHTIVKYIDGKVYTHLLLPPVLGLVNTPAIIEAMREITGLSASETLATPLSVPGWRLNQALQEYYQKNDIELVQGAVVGFDSDSSGIKALRVHAGDDRKRIQARAFVLATGKYIGGGIKKDKSFKESIFNLPLFCEGQCVKDESVFKLSRQDPGESQPFFSLGVMINPAGQVLAEEGEVAYDNLFAAGTILSGFDPTHQRCSTGVSIVSGTLAAKGAGAIC